MVWKGQLKDGIDQYSNLLFCCLPQCLMPSSLQIDMKSKPAVLGHQLALTHPHYICVDVHIVLLA